VTFNYNDFQKYTNNFKKMSATFDSWLSNFLYLEGMRFLAEVKPRTPVDTGDLRAHWRLDGISRNGSELHVWFINPMYYATHVEYGHAPPYKSGIITEGQPGWIQGYFMMTVSLDIVEKALPTRFQREFKQFLLSLGVL